MTAEPGNSASDVETAAEAADPPDTAPERSYATRTEAAYARLREDILSGVLWPGAKLRLDTLRRDYGFGLSSLREALSKLSSERLVRTAGQRGYWVESISESEFRDITEMRLFLEPEALNRSILNATPEWRTAVRAAFDRLSRVEQDLDRDRDRHSAEWELANAAFHQALIRECGSPWMLHFIAVLTEQARRYRRQALTRNAIPVGVLEAEHRAILNAALDGKSRLAAELLRLHISGSAAALASTLFPDPAAASNAPAR